jgi:hypothetical protein
MNNDFVLVRYLGDAVNRRTQFDFDATDAPTLGFSPSNSLWYLNLSQADSASPVSVFRPTVSRPPIMTATQDRHRRFPRRRLVLAKEFQ